MGPRPLLRAAQLLILWGNAAGCAGLATADDWPETDTVAVSSSGASATGTTGAGGTAGAGGSGGCDATALDRLHDDFEARDLNKLLWDAYADDGAIVDQANGLLTVGLPMRRAARGGFQTLDTYDLRGCAVQLAVPSVPDGSSAADTYLALDGPDVTMMVRQQGDDLYFQYWDENEARALASSSVAYLPQHRLWRLVVVDGKVAGQLSMTGSDWDSIGPSIDAPPFLSEARVNIGAATAGASAVPPGTAKFEDVRATEP